MYPALDERSGLTFWSPSVMWQTLRTRRSPTSPAVRFICWHLNRHTCNLPCKTNTHFIQTDFHLKCMTLILLINFTRTCTYFRVDVQYPSNWCCLTNITCHCKSMSNIFNWGELKCFKLPWGQYHNAGVGRMEVLTGLCSSATDSTRVWTLALWFSGRCLSTSWHL